MSDAMAMEPNKEQEAAPELKSDFTAEELKKIESIAGQIDISDSQGVVVYGVGAQREISQFADTILGEVRNKDSGYVGEVLTDMMLKIKGLDVDSLTKGGGFFSKIPIFGKIANAGAKFIARYDKLSVQLESIVDNLDKARMDLLKDITLLDNMYDKNLAYLKNLDIYIAAGEMKLKQLKEVEEPKLVKKAEATNAPEDAQALNDFRQALNRLEKKIHDLKLSRMIAIQTAPQIRLVQNGNQALVEKIQSSILNTIPLWKNQIVISITIFRQKKALKAQKEVSDRTNDLLKQNAALLKDSSLEVAKESERGIVEIETLRQVNDDLIATIEETLAIQEEGRQKRREAEKELGNLEHKLKDSLKHAEEEGMKLGK